MSLINRIKIWKKNEVAKSHDLNGEVNNIVVNLGPATIPSAQATLAQMQATTNPGSLGSENLQATLTGEIQTLRAALSRISWGSGGSFGGKQWYTLPGPASLSDPIFCSPNFLYNPAFLIFQENNSYAVNNGSSTYVADAWYVKNSLGTGGIITAVQYSTIIDPVYAPGGLEVYVSTAPTASQANGCELYQTLPFFDSQALTGNSAYLTFQLKALGNVNQVGAQFYSSSSESKVSIPVGTEQLFSVSTSTSTVCRSTGVTLANPAFPTKPVFGVRIRPTAVTTGNLYDSGNGFVIQAAFLTTGGTPLNPLALVRPFNDELLRCQYLYEKSYNVSQVVGGSSLHGLSWFGANTSTDYTHNFVRFKVPKRVDGPNGATVSFWDNVGNHSDFCTYSGSNVFANAVTTGVVGNISESGFEWYNSSGSYNCYGLHWVCDARI